MGIFLLYLIRKKSHMLVKLFDVLEYKGSEKSGQN